MFDSFIQSIIPFKNISAKEKELIKIRRQQENHGRRTGCHGCVSYALIIGIALALIVFVSNAIN